MQAPLFADSAVPWRLRLLTATLVGCVSALITYAFQTAFGRGAGDLTWAIRLLPDIFAGIDPYGYSIDLTPMAYPLTAGIVAYPFAAFPPELAAAVFMGLSTGLMTFGLLRQGWWRLLILCSYPFWLTLYTVQWSPLLLAVALFPSLLPITMAKPHIGLSVALTNLTWRRTVACVLLGLLSLALLPDWPFRFLGHQAALVRYVWPLFALPFGPLLLLALFRHKQQRAWFLLLLAAVPQHRWGYDALLLWFVPQSPRGALLLLLGGWAGLGCLLLGTQWVNVATGSALAAAAWYLPALWCVWFEKPLVEPGEHGAQSQTDTGQTTPAI